MFETDFTRLLGVQHPLVCAGMGAGTADGELAGRVSEAGALGVIGASWLGPDEIGELAHRAREITSKPIGINLLLFGNEDLLPTVLKAKPAVLSTAWAREDQDLSSIFAMAHESGAKVMHMVPTKSDAERAAEAGADIIVAQGTEGGGHVGLMAATVVVRQVVKAVAPVPVLAAGGFADGAGLAAALALGAHGALMGTRFLATHECPVPQFSRTPSSQAMAQIPSPAQFRTPSPAGIGQGRGPELPGRTSSKIGLAKSLNFAVAEPKSRHDSSAPGRQTSPTTGISGGGSPPDWSNLCCQPRNWSGGS